MAVGLQQVLESGKKFAGGAYDAASDWFVPRPDTAETDDEKAARLGAELEQMDKQYPAEAMPTQKASTEETSLFADIAYPALGMALGGGLATGAVRTGARMLGAEAVPLGARLVAQGVGEFGGATAGHYLARPQEGLAEAAGKGAVDTALGLPLSAGAAFADDAATLLARQSSRFSPGSASPALRELMAESGVPDTPGWRGNTLGQAIERHLVPGFRDPRFRYNIAKVKADIEAAGRRLIGAPELGDWGKQVNQYASDIEELMKVQWDDLHKSLTPMWSVRSPEIDAEVVALAKQQVSRMARQWKFSPLWQETGAASDISQPLMQLLTSVYNLGSTKTAVPIGRLVDQFRRKVIDLEKSVIGSGAAWTGTEEAVVKQLTATLKDMQGMYITDDAAKAAWEEMNTLYAKSVDTVKALKFAQPESVVAGLKTKGLPKNMGKYAETPIPDMVVALDNLEFIVGRLAPEEAVTVVEGARRLLAEQLTNRVTDMRRFRELVASIPVNVRQKYFPDGDQMIARAEAVARLNERATILGGELEKHRGWGRYIFDAFVSRPLYNTVNRLLPNLFGSPEYGLAEDIIRQFVSGGGTIRKAAQTGVGHLMYDDTQGEPTGLAPAVEKLGPERRNPQTEIKNQPRPGLSPAVKGR